MDKPVTREALEAALEDAQSALRHTRKIDCRTVTGERDCRALTGDELCEYYRSINKPCWRCPVHYEVEWPA